MEPTELAREQAYFDAAAEHRDRRLAHLRDLPGAAAHAGAGRRKNSTSASYQPAT